MFFYFLLFVWGEGGEAKVTEHFVSVLNVHNLPENSAIISKNTLSLAFYSHSHSLFASFRLIHFVLFMGRGGGRTHLLPNTSRVNAAYYTIVVFVKSVSNAKFLKQNPRKCWGKPHKLP